MLDREMRVAIAVLAAVIHLGLEYVCRLCWLRVLGKQSDVRMQTSSKLMAAVAICNPCCTQPKENCCTVNVQAALTQHVCAGELKHSIDEALADGSAGNVEQRIQKLLKDNPIMLFMKGQMAGTVL